MLPVSSQPLRLGFFISGGDGPGANSALYHATLAARKMGHEVVVVRNGLVEFSQNPRVTTLPEILPADMPIWPSSNAGSSREQAEEDISHAVKNQMNRLGIHVLIGAVGDGSAEHLASYPEKGVPLVCFPLTIDKNVTATDECVGFSTAVDEICKTAKSTEDTAIAFSRVVLSTTPGKREGHTGLAATLKLGADISILPEFFNPLVETNREKAREAFRSAMRHLMHCYYQRKADFESRHETDITVRNPYAHVVLCEGVKTLEGDTVSDNNGHGYKSLRSAEEYFARLITEETGIAVCSQRISYAPRGAKPNEKDQMLGKVYGEAIVNAAISGQSGMVVIRDGNTRLISMHEAVKAPKQVQSDDPNLIQARERGIHIMGDMAPQRTVSLDPNAIARAYARSTSERELFAGGG